ncbi:MAG: hypothetical protein JO154_10130 [Chitinophaga sp.]|uniref:hypothetical protein n=1 Tax=Chitinophaga sp. TaxID=1869181 RepID=UPI0025B997E8|nr:hypothetical protein [Chitinophaga sp.]MBV8252951.1 hypothetical protein [Chitinophaga sp.]
MTTEATIIITKNEGKTTFISVRIPIWTRRNDCGNLSVNIPLLGFETIAIEENDAEKAVEEAIISFCVIAERFGKGIRRELQALGWRVTGDDKLEYGIIDSNTVVRSIFRTGRLYVNPHLKLALPV